MGLRRLVGVAIVAICIGMPLIESFDSWDHTLTDGNDTEANVVLVALCVGLALSTSAAIVVESLRWLLANLRLAMRSQSVATTIRPALLAPLPTSSPPRLPLRI
jgi:hypothetical protein